jgi:hypothetical protein
MIWDADKIMGNNRNYVVYSPKPGISQNAFYDLYDMMKNYVGSDDPSKMDNSRGEPLNAFPVTKVTVPVDREVVLKNGTANPTDSILTEFRFELPQRALMKNDLIILNIIAANKWKRPIYFTSPIGELGFGQYLRKDGIAYRLVPVVNKFSQMNWVVDQSLRQNGLGGTQIRDNNSDLMFKNLMTKYEFGGADKKGVYFDEENRRHILNIRAIFGEAAGNLADIGRKEDAQKLIDKVETGINPENLLQIRSDVDGSPANIKLEVGGLQTINRVDVQDSFALATEVSPTGVLLVARSSPDGGRAARDRGSGGMA